MRSLCLGCKELVEPFQHGRISRAQQLACLEHSLPVHAHWSLHQLAPHCFARHPEYCGSHRRLLTGDSGCGTKCTDHRSQATCMLHSTVEGHMSISFEHLSMWCRPDRGSMHGHPWRHKLSGIQVALWRRFVIRFNIRVLTHAQHTSTALDLQSPMVHRHVATKSLKGGRTVAEERKVGSNSEAYLCRNFQTKRL